MKEFMPTKQRLAQAILALLAFGYLVSGLVYLYGGRWMVTMQDYWVIYDTCLNRSFIESALTKVNHQPVVFPSLIWLADLRLAHGNQELLFFVGTALLCGTVALLLLPFWQDATISTTAKLEASLVVIVASFWMARASITTSGGFNCICSLALGRAMAAILYLSRAESGATPSLRIHLLVLGAAFVASFSFGTGLAIWPTLLVLGWSMRLPWRSLLVITGGAIVAGVIYHFLPGQSGSTPASTTTVSWSAKAVLMLQYLCTLLGAPILYGQAAWGANALTSKDATLSWISPVAGALGLISAGTVIALRILRRDLGRSRSFGSALGLVLFTLFTMVLVVIGRADRFRSIPSEVAAPRYLFWSTLFWAGLLLLLILAGSRWANRWRWPVFALIVALPVLTFPLHYKEGLHWRHAQFLAHSAATTLINDVRDDKQIAILFRKPAQVYKLAPQLRAARLDMFAPGLQDWLGQPETSLFAGRQNTRRFKANAKVQDLYPASNGTTSAKVTGQCKTLKGPSPELLVFVDEDGVVQGIGRSWTTSKFLHRIFYGGNLSNSFLGYINHYDPARRYFVRLADGGSLSSEQAVVQGQ